MAGIALGVAALIVVLSVMNGFHKVRDRMLSVLPHIEVYVSGGDPERILSQWKTIADDALRSPSVKAAAPFVSAQGMLMHGQELRGVQVRGIDPRDRERCLRGRPPDDCRQAL